MNTVVTPKTRSSFGISLKRRVSFPISVDTLLGTSGALVRRFEVMFVTAKGWTLVSTQSITIYSFLF